jgi:hypothetical protein
MIAEYRQRKRGDYENPLLRVRKDSFAPAANTSLNFRTNAVHVDQTTDVAEMFLIQATLESASVIGDGVSELGRHISQGRDKHDESVQEVLQRIKNEALEPYTSRYQYLKELMGTTKN